MKCSLCKQEGHTKRCCKQHTQYMHHNVSTDVTKFNVFINWSQKSSHIPFKSNCVGVGDGEQKVAYELNTRILGQNSGYDMNITIDGVTIPCDVKKLDKYTFNTGVKGRNLLRPIKHKLTELLTTFKKLCDSSFVSCDEKELLSTFERISPDELCVSVIHKISHACLALHKKREGILQHIPSVTPLLNIDGVPIEMSLYKYYCICKIMDTPLPIQYTPYINNLSLLDYLSHEYIVEPTQFTESLQSLISMFSELKLIFVDEHKGYCIWNDIERIKFERITRGNPRFRVHIHGAS